LFGLVAAAPPPLVAQWPSYPTAGGWLDVDGAPLTSDGKIIERFRRPTFGRLEIDATIDDPKAYTKPWTVRVNQHLLADTDLIEFVCLENQKFDSQLRN
jgi:hypothetical protein